MAYTSPDRLARIKKNSSHVDTMWGEALTNEGENVALYDRPAASGQKLTDAARVVLDERKRQVTAEGCLSEVDDTHDDGQMALVAGNYALACAYPHERDLGRGQIPLYWPWAPSWRKAQQGVLRDAFNR